MDGSWTGLNWKKPLVEARKVDEVVQKSKKKQSRRFRKQYESGDDSSESENDSSSSNDEQSNGGNQDGERRVSVWFDRQQLRDTQQASRDLWDPNKGFYQRLAAQKTIEQSARQLSGDYEGALQSGSDAAIYRGDVNEYLRYERVRAVHGLLESVFGGGR